MPNSKQELIEQLKKQFWETIAKADALRNLAAAQRNEEDAARFIKRAEAEEEKAKGFLKEAQNLSRSDL